MRVDNYDEKSSTTANDDSKSVTLASVCAREGRKPAAVIISTNHNNNANVDPASKKVTPETGRRQKGLPDSMLEHSVETLNEESESDLENETS